ncbi:MAG: RND family transporter, partial [Cellvibrionaceae bacterium]|nr:RND family transporter [Cellvibrionaceae bacterium]
MAQANSAELPVVKDLGEFDFKSGSALERLVFNNRFIVIVLCLLATIGLGYQASKIQLAAGFEKNLPKDHEFVVNYQENKENLKGLGNNLRVVVAVDEGTIFTKENLKYIEQVNDEIFFIPGVDRNGMKSIFTPNTRWRVVTEEGFEGGPVIPGNFDGSERSIAEVKLNIRRAGIVGDLVANNQKSVAIIVPLLDLDPNTGERLDYATLAGKLEEVRAKFTEGESGRSIHIIGFAKLVGDLIEGMVSVMMFFAVAVVIAAVLLYWYTRCLRSTLIVIACTVVAVVWQMGLL